MIEDFECENGHRITLHSNVITFVLRDGGLHYRCPECGSRLRVLVRIR